MNKKIIAVLGAFCLALFGFGVAALGEAVGSDTVFLVGWVGCVVGIVCGFFAVNISFIITVVKFFMPRNERRHSSNTNDYK